MTRQEAQEKLQHVRTLQPGWNGYDAIPPEESTIRHAEELLGSISDAMMPDRVAPSCGGGSRWGAIGMTWKSGHKRAYLEVADMGDDCLLFTHEGRCWAEGVPNASRLTLMLQQFFHGD